MFNKLVKITKQQNETIKSFKSQSDQLEQSNKTAIAKDIENWFDSQVAKLGDDFKDSLGSGSYGSSALTSSQKAKRDALADQVAVLFNGNREIGKNVSRDEVFAAASRIVLASDYEKAHEKKLSAKLEKRSTQHINRVGGKAGKETENAADEVARIIDEKYFGKT
jgi:hypothetical protein